MLQETWLEKEWPEKSLNKIAKGFTWYQKTAERRNERGRASGGHLIGIKKSLRERYEVKKWKYGMIIKIRSEEREKWLWIIEVYNPVGFGTLEGTLKNHVENGIEQGAGIIIVGDLNARIGRKSGIVECEKSGGIAWLRNSEDNVVNTEGRKLLNFCDKLGLAIMNGRTKGDEMGRVTYVGGGGGSSVLDLVIWLEDEDEGLLQSLEVIPRVESDHLPVALAVQGILRQVKKTEKGKNKTLRVKKLVWDEKASTEYEEEINKAWVEGADPAGMTTNERWTKLKETIWTAAEKAGLVKTALRGGKNEIWLSEEEKLQKKKVWACLKKYLKNKTDRNRIALADERKEWREIIEKKQKEWFEKRWRLVTECKDMAEWWRAIGKFRTKRKYAGENIGKGEWVEHFKELLNGAGEDEGQENQPKPWEEEETTGNAAQNELDQEIGKEEFLKTIKKLKRRKAAGEDGITGEFFKYLPERVQEELRAVINKIWEEGNLPEKWKIARIFPIHKAGDENDVKNYRGISLLNLGYKILTNIMANRIRNWVEKEGIIKESQAGFRPKRGTRDHIFVLNALINNRLRKKKGKLYVAFVDFKAAFDKIDRNLLLKKLWEKGLRGRMHRMVRGIYGKTTNEIIASEGTTESFETEKGVRQGCPLSPTLFGIALDDVDEEWERKGIGGTVMGKGKFYAMKYADDIAILAEEADELKKMLKILEKYVEKTKMEVNVKKTKIMVFRRGDKRKKDEGWKFKDEIIEVVNEFKYLGFLLSTNNTLKKHLNMVAGKARKAANAVWGVMKRAGVNNLKQRLQLMDSLVKSGALYGVELWGWRRREEIEKMQGRFVKMALGIARNTPNYLWKIEADRSSVEIEARRRAGNYLLEILKMDGNRWPNICLKEEIRNISNGNASKWGEDLKDAMAEVGEGRIWNLMRSGGQQKEIEKILTEGLETKRDQDIQKDWVGIDKSTFTPMYKDIKKEIGRAKYWEEKEVKGHIKEEWARLRCGNIGKVGKKGFLNWKCELCEEDDESLEHVWTCQIAREEIKKEWVEAVDTWRNNRTGSILDNWTIETLQGEINKDICEYMRSFRRLEKEYNERERMGQGREGEEEI